MNMKNANLLETMLVVSGRGTRTPNERKIARDISPRSIIVMAKKRIRRRIGTGEEKENPSLEENAARALERNTTTLRKEREALLYTRKTVRNANRRTKAKVIGLKRDLVMLVRNMMGMRWRSTRDTIRLGRRHQRKARYKVGLCYTKLWLYDTNKCYDDCSVGISMLPILSLV